jgi:predicted AlkP superfamily pyrophosphatase or phosphodiesterase
MKTLLILVDGMRPDALASCPAAQKVLAEAVYTLNARTVMPSVTLPCHMSLFYSVEPGRHGTTTNVYSPQVRPIDSLCDVLAAQRKSSAFFYSWGELRDLCRPSSLAYSLLIKGGYHGWAKANDRLTDAAIEYIGENDPDLTFLYLGYPDEAGHSHGWMGEEYMRSLDNSWENIARIMAAIPKDYSVIITADHGGHDRMHGTAMPEDMTIPLIFAGAERSLVGDLTDANIMDIAPTVAAIEGIIPCADWEGKNLLA